VDVHPVFPWNAEASQLQLPRSEPDEQPIGSPPRARFGEVDPVSCQTVRHNDEGADSTFVQSAPIMRVIRASSLAVRELNRT
jgi:hypothetical protein